MTLDWFMISGLERTINTMAVLKATIQLKSDLCAGSGYSYAGIIDSDVCYTDLGLPYIPARRLKGCLRESAELIGLSTIDQIFGVRGDSKPGSIKISNAYLADNDDLSRQIEWFKQENPDLFSQAEVIEQYTTVKAQTAINNETGKAKENTLRFTRVVNHYSSEKEENRFICEVEINDEYAKDIKKAFNALRHIGMDRNRGLGSVKCMIEPTEKESPDEKEYSFSDEREYRIDYSLENVQPLILSNDNAGRSEIFIPGQSVLGFFASKCKENEEGFDDLFLNGSTIFSNLYPEVQTSDNGSSKKVRTFPVPAYIQKLKKSKKTVNVLFDEDASDEEYSPKDGNQPKKINDAYAYIIDGQNMILFEPESDVVYHHSKRTEDNSDGILYSLTKLNEGNIYKGFIVVKGKHAKNLIRILNENCPYFGKSKSAQYGKCIVRDISVSENVKEEKEYKGKVAVVLKSDGIFVYNDSYYTSNADEVKEIIAEQLGIRSVINGASYGENGEKDHDYVSSKYITGYNTKWNLKKPSFSAIKAGSTFIFDLDSETKIDACFVGEKNHEGYGEIMILPLSEMSYKINVKKGDPANVGSGIEKMRPELLAILRDRLYIKLFDDAINERNNLKITSSLLGRVILMAKQSEDKKDLLARVESIKSEEKKKIKKFLDNVIGNGEAVMLHRIDSYDEYALLKKYEADDDYINRNWKAYLINLLAQEKYHIKEKGKYEGDEDE